MSGKKELEYLDNPDFNQSIDEEIGEFRIYSEVFNPSYVLFELKQETYRIALTDFNERKFEELQQLVFDNFPVVVAYNYRLLVRGPGANDPVKKFLHLKDAWEGAINILNALAFGEVRAKCINMKSANVYRSSNPNLYFNSRTIRTDELKQRLENVKAIINYSITASLNLKIAQYVSAAVLDYLYDLQDNRNHFSHTSTPTKEQAEEELIIVLPLFERVLTELQFLENVNIVRFDSFSTKCRFETFKGHYLNKEYEEIEVDSAILPYVMKYPGEAVLAIWHDEIFCLSPFIHFENDGTGHETYLCYYKRKKRGKHWYEPVKIRNEKAFDNLQIRFDAEMQQLAGLMVP